MLTSVASPLSQAIPHEASMPWHPTWETCQSAGQLQLMGLVKRWGAAAGWIVGGSHNDDPDHPGDDLRCAPPEAATNPGSSPYHVVGPGVAAADLPPTQWLTSAAFLAQIPPLAQGRSPEAWAFCHRMSALAQGWMAGVRFWVTPSLPWFYLLLWFPDGPDAEGPIPGADGLISEVAALRTALHLDQETQSQRQQVAHYQQILRRLEHQLRHPLAMVHLYAANLQNGLTNDHDRQQAQTIREAVGHLSDHLTDLIAGCQRSQVQMEACGVSSLWAEAWQGVQPLAQTQEVSLVLADQPLTLWGDRAQLVQAFTNLLHNALCFSPPQGQITAQWQAFQREVVITLADQGPGLSSMDLQNLFRPYYSTRPQGSGLGLTIARHIVQQHGGKLWAENLPQGGAQFSLALPLVPPLPPPDADGGAG